MRWNFSYGAGRLYYYFIFYFLPSIHRDNETLSIIVMIPNSLNAVAERLWNVIDGTDIFKVNRSLTVLDQHSRVQGDQAEHYIDRNRWSKIFVL
jgi:hypothetical protein